MDAVQGACGSIQIFSHAAPEAGLAAIVGPASRAAYRSARGISAWHLTRNNFRGAQSRPGPPSEAIYHIRVSRLVVP